jgi:hypothetical protein
MSEQVIDDTGDLMGRGHDGRFRTEAGSHPPVVGAQAMMAATGRWRRQPEGLARTVSGLERTPAQDLPPRDLTTEPGSNRDGRGSPTVPGVLDGRPDSPARAPSPSCGRSVSRIE